MNPFDLTGQEFLGLYVVVLIAGVCLSAALRWRLRQPADEPGREALNLSPYEVAYLSGGENLAANAAIARLVQDGVLKADPKARTITVLDKLPAGTADVERAVHAAASQNGDGKRIGDIRAAARDAARPLRDRLEADGLIVDSAQSFSVRLAPVLIILGILTMGVIKIMVGASRDRPVGFLIVLCALTVVVAFAFGKVPHRSRRGDYALERLKQTNAALQYCLSRRDDYVSSQDLVLALGLFGLDVLAGSPLADLKTALSPPPGSGSSCGGGCGGGGCGGGGGGCGGCGA